MSRAFVSEEAADREAAALPERPVSTAPNLVTQEGLAQIDREIERLLALHAAAPSDDPTRPAIDRDLRYWRARRASAQLVPPIAGIPTEITFGCRVTIRRQGGPATTYRIVGEDEADPPRGRLSWTSPLAKALLGARLGDTVEIGAGRPTIVVEAITAG